MINLSVFWRQRRRRPAIILRRVQRKRNKLNCQFVCHVHSVQRNWTEIDAKSIIVTAVRPSLQSAPEPPAALQPGSRRDIFHPYVNASSLRSSFTSGDLDLWLLTFELADSADRSFLARETFVPKFWFLRSYFQARSPYMGQTFWGGRGAVLSGGTFWERSSLWLPNNFHSTSLLVLLLLLFFFFFCLAISFFAVRTFLHVLHISLLMCHCIYSAIQLSSCKCVFNKLSCQLSVSVWS